MLFTCPRPVKISHKYFYNMWLLYIITMLTIVKGNYLCLSHTVLGCTKMVVVLILKERVKVWVWSTSIRIHRRRCGDGLFGVFLHLFFDLNGTADGDTWPSLFQQAVLCCCCSELLQLLQYVPPEGTASHSCVIISEAGYIQYLLE